MREELIRMRDIDAFPRAIIEAGQLRAAYVLGALCEAVYHLGWLPGEPPMTRFAAKSLAKPRWFDISAAARDLGYAPSFDPEEAMRRTVEHFRRER